LIIVGEVFASGAHEFDEFLPDLLFPLQNREAKVRLQTCRCMADYARDEKTIEEMFEKEIYRALIDHAENDEVRAREQAVYSVVRGFGLGSAAQKKKLAEMGGLKVVLEFTTIAVQPFNCNLIDCMHTLVDEDFAYFIPKLRELHAVRVFYQLMASSDQVLTSRAANLLGIVGDDYTESE
jgi:hypothetical protein